MDVDLLEKFPEVWRDLVGDGTAGLTGEDLGRVSRAARQVRELADHLEVTTLGVLDRDGYADSLGYSTASWFAAHAKVAHGTARHQLATARLLETELAPVAQAWFEGTITRDHLQVLLRAANPRIRDQIAERLDELIDDVATTRFDVWKDQVQALARDLDQDGVEPDDPTVTCASWSRSDVFAMLRCQFNAADAELVGQIVETRTDQLFRAQAKAFKANPDLVVLTRAQLRGRAVVQLLVQSQAVDPNTAVPAKTAVHLVVHAYFNGDTTPESSDPEPGTDPECDGRDPFDETDPDRTDAESDRDGVDEAEATDLSHGTEAFDGFDPATEPEPEATDHEVTDPEATDPVEGTDEVDRTDGSIRFDWPGVDALATATWRITNPDGRRLDARGLDALLGDVEIHPLLVDHDDNPLKLGATIRPSSPVNTIESLLAHPAVRARLLDATGNPLYRGRTRRYAPDDLRRVVLIRDGGCIFPGCDCVVGWADVHHVIFWEDGGLTDIVVLVALCRRHHGVAHRKGWSLRPSGDGWFIWRTPTGLRMWSQRHGIQRAGPLPPEGHCTVAA